MNGHALRSVLAASVVAALGLRLLVPGPACDADRGAVTCVAEGVTAPSDDMAGHLVRAPAPPVAARVPASTRASRGRAPGAIDVRDVPRQTPEDVPAEEVLVSGRLLRWGEPLTAHDLAFRPAGVPRHREPSDWDFTDEHGRFVVLLPPGRYVVTGAPDETWRRELVVPATATRFEADLRLP